MSISRFFPLTLERGALLHQVLHQALQRHHLRLCLICAFSRSARCLAVLSRPGFSRVRALLGSFCLLPHLAQRCPQRHPARLQRRDRERERVVAVNLSSNTSRGASSRHIHVPCQDCAGETHTALCVRQGLHYLTQQEVPCLTHERDRHGGGRRVASTEALIHTHHATRSICMAHTRSLSSAALAYTTQRSQPPRLQNHMRTRIGGGAGGFRSFPPPHTP